MWSSAASSGPPWGRSAVSDDLVVWSAILAMALVTWLTRIAGFWLMRLVPEGGLVRRGIDHLPGALVVSILAPIALDGALAGDWAPTLAIVAAVLIGRAGMSAMIAVFGAVGIVALARLVV